MSYIILRGRRCNIIVLNVHTPTEDKIDYIKNKFHEEIEHVFDKFPKYHMKMLLGDSMTKKVGKTFSNLLLGMRVYTKLVMIMESE
jgi:hypothetical protein